MAFSIFRTKEDREKRLQEYRAKMAPLGEEQIAHEKKLAAACVRSGDLDDSEAYYAFLRLKEILLAEKETPDAKKTQKALRQWSDSILVKKLPGNEKKQLYSLAFLSVHASALEELPGMESVRALALEQREPLW